MAGKAACALEAVVPVYVKERRFGWRGSCQCGWFVIRRDKDEVWERLAAHVLPTLEIPPCPTSTTTTR